MLIFSCLYLSWRLPNGITHLSSGIWITSLVGALNVAKRLNHLTRVGVDVRMTYMVLWAPCIKQFSIGCSSIIGYSRTITSSVWIYLGVWTCPWIPPVVFLNACCVKIAPWCNMMQRLSTLNKTSFLPPLCCHKVPRREPQRTVLQNREVQQLPRQRHHLVDVARAVVLAQIRGHENPRPVLCWQRERRRREQPGRLRSAALGSNESSMLIASPLLLPIAKTALW